MCDFYTYQCFSIVLVICTCICDTKTELSLKYHSIFHSAEYPIFKYDLKLTLGVHKANKTIPRCFPPVWPVCRHGTLALPAVNLNSVYKSVNPFYLLAAHSWVCWRFWQRTWVWGKCLSPCHICHLCSCTSCGTQLHRFQRGSLQRKHPFYFESSLANGAWWGEG